MCVYLDEKFDDLDAVLLAGDVKRREAVESARVHVGLVVEQQLGDLDVAAVSGHVQGGEKVARGLIDELGRVKEEHARRLDVIALRGHVQRRETVARLGVDGRLTFDEHLHDLVVARSRRTMQWRETILLNNPSLIIFIRSYHQYTRAPFSRHKTIFLFKRFGLWALKWTISQ